MNVRARGSSAALSLLLYYTMLYYTIGPYALYSQTESKCDNEVKLISARPGNLTAFALLWLKTRRLGRFLKKT